MTLWLASWGVVSFPHVWDTVPRFLLAGAPVMFPAFFFMMELINKRIERKFTYRARQIHAFLNGPAEQSGSYLHFISSGNLGGFLIYDPAGANWLRSGINDDDREDFRAWIGWRSILLKSWGLAVYYVGLVTVSIVCAAWLLSSPVVAQPSADPHRQLQQNRSEGPPIPGRTSGSFVMLSN